MSKQPVGSDLWYDPEVYPHTCIGSKEDVTLYLSQELWHVDPDDIDTVRSSYVAEVDALGHKVRLPVESARQLFHALGAVLEED